MRRRDEALKRKMAEEQQFVTKVANIPAVSSALSTVCGLYQKTKDSNGLLNYTLTAAETGVRTVAGTAQPLITRYEEPLKKVNDYACDKLDQLTTTYPVLHKPTDELISDGKEIIQPAVATVTAVKEMGVDVYNKSVDTVSGVTQYGLDTVTNVTNYGKETVIGVATYGKDKVCDVTNYGKETVTNVANYGIETVSNVTTYGKEKVTDVTNYSLEKVTDVTNYGKSTVSSVTDYGKGQIGKVTTYGQERLTDMLKTSAGQALVSQVVSVLSASEGYVDKYLPPMEESSDEDIAKATDDDVIARVAALRTKLQRRTVRRALKNIMDVRIRSKELLDKLRLSMNMVEYARRNLDSVVTAGEGVSAQITGTVTDAQTKFWQMWTDITAEGEGEVKGEGEDAAQKSLEQRSVYLARQVVSQLRSTVSSLQTTVTYLPTTARAKYDDLHKYTEDLVAAFKNVQQASDISNWMIAQTRDTIGQLQTTLTSLVDTAVSSAPISWIVNQGWIPKYETPAIEIEMEEVIKVC